MADTHLDNRISNLIAQQNLCIQQNRLSPQLLKKARILSLLQQLKSASTSSSSSSSTPTPTTTPAIPSTALITTTLTFKTHLHHYLSNVIIQLSRSNLIPAPLSPALDFQSLKLLTKKLSNYIKILINNYLFPIEFNHLFAGLDPHSLNSKKQKFLKLLQTLLNNNILNPNSLNPKYITISSLDDPLIRFLIVNKIIVVHPSNQNKIKLKDLSFNI